ncbi:hypothetical protein N9948_01930 [bacterium]|nr:hypothetical protein [bacterium]
MKSENKEHLENLVEGNSWDTSHLRQKAWLYGDTISWKYNSFDAVDMHGLFSRTKGYIEGGGKDSDLVKDLASALDKMYRLVTEIHYSERLYNAESKDEEFPS